VCRIFKSAVGIKPTASYENEGRCPDFTQNQFYLDALTMLDEVKKTTYRYVVFQCPDPTLN
jgi:hypothetical protein